jgi:hypothetical protein
MERDLLADEPPPTGKKAPPGPDVGSPATQVVSLVAVAVIGFSVTSAAMWFGPRVVEYVKELSAPSPQVAKKSGDATRSNPLRMPEFKPLWDTSQPPVLQGPSVPSVSFPQGNGIWNPNPARGSGTRGFNMHR